MPAPAPLPQQPHLTSATVIIGSPATHASTNTASTTSTSATGSSTTATRRPRSPGVYTTALLAVVCAVICPSVGLPLRRPPSVKNVTPVSVEGRDILLCWVVQIQTHAVLCGDGGSNDCGGEGRRRVTQHAHALSRELDLEIHHTFGQFLDHLLLCHNPGTDHWSTQHPTSTEAPQARRSSPIGKTTSASISQLHRLHSDLKVKDTRLFDLWRQMVEVKLAEHPEVLTFSSEHAHRRKSRLDIPPRKSSQTQKDKLNTSASPEIPGVHSEMSTFDTPLHPGHQLISGSSSSASKLKHDFQTSRSEPKSSSSTYLSSRGRHINILAAQSPKQGSKRSSSAPRESLKIFPSLGHSNTLSVPSISKSFSHPSGLSTKFSGLRQDHKPPVSDLISNITFSLLYRSPSSSKPSFNHFVSPSKLTHSTETLKTDAHKNRAPFTSAERRHPQPNFPQTRASDTLKSQSSEGAKNDPAPLSSDSLSRESLSVYLAPSELHHGHEQPYITLYPPARRVSGISSQSRLRERSIPSLPRKPLSLYRSHLKPRQRRAAAAPSTSSVRALKDFEKLYAVGEDLDLPVTSKAKSDRLKTLYYIRLLGIPKSRIRRMRREAGVLSPPMAFNDPAYPKQWHLYNRVTPGMDINVTGVWRHNITGRGVTVAVVDDGMEWRNPDLKANYNYKGSWDLNDDDPDPSPNYGKVSNHHGTRCAGEIAAVANNNVCGVGVAYSASVAGVRVLDGVMTDSMEAEAFNKNMDINAIFSCSWGPDDDGATVDGPHLMAAKAMKFGVDFGRGGFGSIFVVASGNGGENGDNCNYDGYANSIYTVTIGAVDEDGGMPYYAEECASMLGVTFSSGTLNKRDIVTTDWLPGQNGGSSAGGEGAGGALGFRSVGGDGGVKSGRSAGGGVYRGASSAYGSSAGGCTERHTGTSAAAPLAAGMVALMLEARPCLTWRDVQYIVALTARKVDVDVAHWQSNGAGLSHSHKHGFGLLSAWRLVNAARIWRTVPWLTSYSVTDESSEWQIPKGRRTPLTIPHRVTQRDIQGLSLFIVEHVQLTVWLAHPCRGKIEVKVISPAGTVSMLAATRPKDNSSNGFTDWTFTTVRCWGETPTGNWTILVTDVDEHGKHDHGRLSKYRLTLFGTPMTPEEFSKRRQLVEAAMTGQFLHSNYSLHCPPRPKYKSVYAPVSERVLKIIILSGVFLLVMAIYETFEYLFCYDDEKKEAQQTIRSARRAARLAQESVAGQDVEQTSALLAQQDYSSSNPPVGNSRNFLSRLTGAGVVPNSTSSHAEEEDEDEELSNISESSRLLSLSQRLADQRARGKGDNLAGKAISDISLRQASTHPASLPEVIPLSTFFVEEVEHLDNLDNDGLRESVTVDNSLASTSSSGPYEGNRSPLESRLVQSNGNSSALNG